MKLLFSSSSRLSTNIFISVWLLQSHICEGNRSVFEKCWYMRSIWHHSPPLLVFLVLRKISAWIVFLLLFQKVSLGWKLSFWYSSKCLWIGIVEGSSPCFPGSKIHWKHLIEFSVLPPGQLCWEDISKTCDIRFLEPFDELFLIFYDTWMYVC